MTANYPVTGKDWLFIINTNYMTMRQFMLLKNELYTTVTGMHKFVTKACMYEMH